MKSIYKKIWDLALTYQDAREDKGHGKVVTHYATKICKIEKVNEDVVVPAAILHDIGWSQLSKNERMLIFDHSVSQEKRLKARYKHQDLGVKLAKNILKEINYPEELTNEILEIISQHDTRKGFLSDNEGAVRDADKLWRFSKTGFYDDINKSNITSKYYYEKLHKLIGSPDFFYFGSSRKIAKEELDKRFNEFSSRKFPK